MTTATITAEPSMVERNPRVRDFWTAALIMVLWAWICVPKILQTLLSPKFYTTIGVEDPPYSKAASVADYGLYYCVIGVCVLIVVGYLADINVAGSWRLIALLAPWVYIVVRDLYAGKSISHEGVIYFCVVLAVWSLRPSMKRLDVLGYLMGLTAILSVVIAVLQPSQAIFRSALGEILGADKQILPWGVLVGIFTQGNNLGQFLALGLPAIFLIRLPAMRYALVAVSLLAILWSASRGSLLAVGIGAVAFIAISAVPLVARRIVGPLIVVVPFVVVVIIPLLTTSPAAFSNRGFIWLASLKYWYAQPWIGNGSDWYHVVGNSSARLAGSVYHGHNQFIQLVVTGGVIFLLLVLVSLVIATVRASRFAASGRVFGIVWLAMLGGSCVFEKTFSYVDNVNFLVAMVIPFSFLVLADRSADEPTEVPDADGAPTAVITAA